MTKNTSLFAFLSSYTKLAGMIFAVCAVLGGGLLRAQEDPPGGPYKIVYNPNSLLPVQGEAPLHYEYVLSVTSPSVLPIGSTTITLNRVATTAPAGVDVATASSFLKFSTPTLVFSGPNESQNVTVTVDIPTGTAEGSFAYFISTSGWPGGLNILDAGTNINMIVLPPSGLQAPSVSINSPAVNATFTYTRGGAAVSVPISVRGEATDNAPVLTLTATISAVDAAGSTTVPSTPLNLVLTGAGTQLAVGAVDYPANQPGVYTITATATNLVGTSTTSSTFIVTEVIPPPTVDITVPPDATYTYYLGSPALVIPYTFEGRSLSDGITGLTATLNGSPVTFTATNLGEAVATGTGVFNLSTGGHYKLVVTATDDIGTATDFTEFDIVVVRPTPTIVINDPLNGTVLTHTTGTPNLNVPFTFTTTTSDNFTVDAVRATLDGAPLPITTITPGLGTSTVVAAAGTMAGVAPGTHTLVAYGTSGGIEVTTSIQFTIKEVSPPANTPPTVVINSPAPNATFTVGSSGGCGGGVSLSIPLTFTGTSTSADAVITKLTAKVDSTVLTVSSTNLNQKTANGSATMKITKAGTHTITVTATDKYGTATATQTFTVVVSNTKYTVKGTVFFDVNFDGGFDTFEYGLAGVGVKLTDTSGRTLATTTTACDGTYKFTILPGSYLVTVAGLKGMALTTLNDHPITVSNANVTAPNTGYGLKFADIKTLCANGYTIGYWKNNIDKALAGKCNGVQVSAKTLKAYTCTINGLALDPFKDLTMSTASSTMSSTSSTPSKLLAKQLVASEYNYANGALIGGSRTLTYAFVYYAEYVLKNSSSYSSSYVLWVKDWCDAYNNSHGGKVLGPNP